MFLTEKIRILKILDSKKNLYVLIVGNQNLNIIILIKFIINVLTIYFHNAMNLYIFRR